MNNQPDGGEQQCKFLVLGGVEGPSLYLNEHRIAGPKPWGGATSRQEFTVSTAELLAELGLADHAAAREERNHAAALKPVADGGEQQWHAHYNPDVGWIIYAEDEEVFTFFMPHPIKRIGDTTSIGSFDQLMAEHRALAEGVARDHNAAPADHAAALRAEQVTDGSVPVGWHDAAPAINSYRADLAYVNDKLEQTEEALRVAVGALETVTDALKWASGAFDTDEKSANWALFGQPAVNIGLNTLADPAIASLREEK